jgi:hypothetical protein
MYAGVAQLVEQLICNQQVAGSNPAASSSFFPIDRLFEALKKLSFTVFSFNLVGM